MSNAWFRMYAEVLNDPKVQKLPVDLFKIWVNTLCVACNNNGTLPNLEDVSFALRLPFHETKKAFQELEKSSLLVTDGETFQIEAWKKRQYKSDTSTSRVKRFRNKNRNVTETPRAQTDTDTEQNRIIDSEDKSSSSCTELKKTRIDFDFSSGKFQNITDDDRTRWGEAYPALKLDEQIAKAAAWLVANPKNRKSNYERFLLNWFSKAQDRAPPTSGTRQPMLSFEERARNNTDLAAQEARKKYAKPS